MKKFVCAICQKKISKGNILTMCSIGVKGNSVITHVCKKCSSDPIKMNKLRFKLDHILR